MIRVGTSILGLALAVPVAHAFDAAGRSQGRYSGSPVSRVFDGISVIRGFQSLRFTRYEQIERGLTVANFSLPGLFALLVALV